MICFDGGQNSLYVDGGKAEQTGPHSGIAGWPHVGPEVSYHDLPVYLAI